MANSTGFKHTKVYSSIMHGTDFCKHVSEDDTSKGVGFFYEKDSHGYVFTEIVCQECKDETQKEIDEEPTCCADCSQDKPRKEVYAWKPYDFYEAQGDEPLMICDACWVLPTHKARIEKDDRDRAEELGDDY